MHCAGQRIDASSSNSAPTASLLRRVPWLRDVVSAVHVDDEPDSHSPLPAAVTKATRATSCGGQSQSAFCARSRSSPRRRSPFPTRAAESRSLVETSDEVALVARRRDGAGHPPFACSAWATRTSSGEGIYFAGDWRERRRVSRRVRRALRRQPDVRPSVHVQRAGLPKSAGRRGQLDASHPFYTDIQRFAWRVQRGCDRRLRAVSRTTSTRATRFAWSGTFSTSAASCASVRRGD